ncbi:MAG: oxidoreductase [Rhodobacteraceae bacterium]|nr:oxidoreductase [Paracoccaceae bacterium]MBR9819774.1 oxidoreductase [Paracoccaceae bacterium]
MSGVIVIGAGQAASALAAKLRAGGYEAPVTLIGEERDPPYQRPPLSKAYLLGEMPRDRLYLRPESFYAEAGITLRLGAPVTRIDPQARRVHLGEEALPFDHLVLATGARPRRLPAAIGGDLAGVFTLRGIADIEALAPLMRPGARLLVVGGGYIGLEAAAVARKLGLEVTLVEQSARILQRVAARETSDWFRALHQSHGVEIREGVGLARLTGETRVEGAELSDGTRLRIDLVIAGIGVSPESGLADAAGIACGNGIAVDAQGRTSAPGIWAAGDCAAFPWRGRQLRLESVQNAIEQAECVAANIMGAGRAYDPHPWFWSDQYDVKLQIAGLGQGHDHVVTRPGKRAGSVSHWYFAGPRLLAVDAMNDPRAYMAGKRMLEQGRSPEATEIADPTQDLAALMRAPARQTEES